MGKAVGVLQGSAKIVAKKKRIWRRTVETASKSVAEFFMNLKPCSELPSRFLLPLGEGWDAVMKISGML